MSHDASIIVRSFSGQGWCSMAEEDPSPPLPVPDVNAGAGSSVSPPEPERLSQGMTDAPELADQAAIDELLKQANFDDPASATATLDPGADASDFRLPDFNQVMQDAQVSII